MDYIGKKDLVYAESRRLFYTGIAWIIGPSLGIWLWNEVLPWSVFALAMLSSVSMLAFFWYLRLGNSSVISKAKKSSVNPLRVIPRYFSQPALRIAYMITLSRSTFWMTLFIYGPIYVIDAGLPPWVAGGLLSFTSGLLLSSPLIRRLAARVGTRSVIVAAFIICGCSMLMLFVTGEARPLGLIYWVFAAIGGNIPFMRMVKAHERTEMTMIFSTWREASQILTPLLASLVLWVTVIEVFYLLLALMLFSAAVAASYLPRRL